MISTKLAAAFLGGVSVCAVATAAFAQAPASPAPASPAPANSATIGEIVVTGSRVIANGNNSPTPVTVVQAQELMALQPTTINDALNNLPVFQGSRGQSSLPNTTGLFGGGNPATTQLNLRNLASQRTLVLFDGQRVAPTNALGVVDVDMVPQELIQRVDIVTGGVSAVYGSDAIAGVVNYITDKNFNGFKMEANYGISGRHDDQSWKAGFAAGTQLFDGKGHIEVSYDHYDNAGIPANNDRNYYSCKLLGATPPTVLGGTIAAIGTAANPYADFCNVHNAQQTYGGLISNGTLKGQTFDSNGVLSPFAHGALTGTANSEIGGDGTIGGESSMVAPVKFDQVFVRFDYDVTDSIRFHTEAAGNWKVDTTYSNPTNFNNQTYSTQNAFLSAATKAALGSAATFTMSKDYTEIPLLTQVSNVKNIFINTGFDGSLGKYTWGVSLNYSDNIIHDVFENNVNSQKLAAALDAVVNPATGQIVCNASLTNSAYANCVPFNAFGPNAASQAAINYVTETTHLTPEFTQIEAGGHMDGSVFTLPAGDVKGSISAEYRKQTFTQTADALPTEFNPCTGGQRYNCGPTVSEYQVAFANSAGSPSQTVKEGAVEVDIPVFKDLPFAQSVNINGAVRYTSYDFGGNAWTWKVGLDWHVNDDVTIRATQSQDIEAPTLGMIFQPLLVAYVGNQDTLTGASPTVPASNTGATNLVSEVGHTTTAGFVWRPHFIPGFSASVDAYHIIVDGALIQVQGQSPVVQQVCYASGGTSPYCLLQQRPLGNYTNTSAANTVTGWTDVYENVSKIETYGADIEVNYANRAFDRPYSVRLLTTWQPHYLFAQPGAPTYDFGGVAFPNLVPLQDVPSVQMTGIFNVALTSKFTATVSERWRSSLALEPANVGIFNTTGTGPYATTDINLSYQLGRAGNEVYFNVRNLFDNLAPVLVGISGSNGYPQTDDPVGRYFTVGFRSRF